MRVFFHPNFTVCSCISDQILFLDERKGLDGSPLVDVLVEHEDGNFIVDGESEDGPGKLMNHSWFYNFFVQK